MVGDKFRLRFQKTGTLRLLSHLDLMRCAERMLRRADLPFKQTGGFHPTPRIVFALSLPLGIVGSNEVVELELLSPHDSEDVRNRLGAQAPNGLTFHAARVIPMNASAVPRRAVYELPLPPGRADDVAPRIAELLAQDKIWVDRIRPRPRRVNIRPYVRSISATAEAITFDLWVTQTGTAKADELAILLGLGDLLTAGAVLNRLDLEVHDEVPADAADGPPTGPPELAPLNHVAAPAATDEDEPTTGHATWGMSPNGPVVE